MNIIEVYNEVKVALLGCYPWSFAKHTVTLTAAKAGSDRCAFYYRHLLPVDFLRALSVETNVITGFSYRLENDALHCDEKSVTLTYLRLVPEQELPAYFLAALRVRIAAELLGEAPAPLSADQSVRVNQFAAAALDHAQAQDKASAHLVEKSDAGGARTGWRPAWWPKAAP